MVANQRDADAIGDFAIQKVIREPFEIGPTEFGTDRVKPSGVGGGEFDEMPQLLFEFVTQHG